MKKFFLVACIMLTSCIIIAQRSLKKWDGGGRNNRWGNAANWQPNGVPGFDSVVLDNSIVTGDYQVVFPDTALGRMIFKITVAPDTMSGRKIELKLPSTNNVVNAVQVGNIELRKGAVLTHSGGGSGITQIDISGSFRIKKGAEYVHNTLARHNFLLEHIELDGTVRFKVPAYEYQIDLHCSCYKRNIILDGSAVPDASSEIRYTTKTDTGPVDSFIIGSRVRFYPYSISRLYVGHLVVDGTLDLSYSYRDFTLNFQSWDGSIDASLSGLGPIESNGRRIDIRIPSTIIFQLKRNLRLTYPVESFIVNSGGTLDMGSYNVSGPGTFKTIADSKLQLGSPDGIWATMPYGNVQTATRIFDDSTSYEYKSSGIQHTGDGLPVSIKQLIINKSSGDLLLTRSTTVRNNLKLLRGKLKTTASKLLTYYGDNDHGSPENLYGNHYGWENSFVDGPMAILFPGAAHIRIFPVGKGNTFAPFMLLKRNAGSITYTGEYFPTASPTITAVNPPLHHISRVEYWTIRSSSLGSVIDPADDANLWLTWRPMSRIGTSLTDRINLRVARYENSGSSLRWDAQTFTGTLGAPSGYRYDYMTFLATLVTDFGSRTFTLGSLTAGNPMIAPDPLPVTRRGQTISETNAILYPNPVQHTLHVNIPGISSLEIINPAGQIVQKQFSQTGNLVRVDMSGFAAGTYFLRVYKNGQQSVYPFIKR